MQSDPPSSHGSARLHQPVLLAQCLDALHLDGGNSARAQQYFVDATFGRGGHSGAILARLRSTQSLLALDRDPQAIEYGKSQATFAEHSRFALAHSRFSQLDTALDAHGIDLIDGILFDLGVSSPQLDQAERGFSFKQDGPLDMRMDPTHGISARQWLLQTSEQELAGALRDYGEERLAIPIAKAIIARRRDAGESALQTTGELARLVAGVVLGRQGRSPMGKDPATRSFQAIRIFINQEFEELKAGLAAALRRLAPGGRLVVISFHSLEDRIVKQFMQEHSIAGAARDPITGQRIVAGSVQLRVFKKTLASASESDVNPRARSAVLRVAERLA